MRGSGHSGRDAHPRGPLFGRIGPIRAGTCFPPPAYFNSTTQPPAERHPEEIDVDPRGVRGTSFEGSVGGDPLEMKKTLPVITSLVLFNLVAWPLAGHAQVEGSLSPEVDALFQPWDSPESPGAAVLIVEKGEVVHARGYGMADLEHGAPITTRTVFDVASLAKQFAAMAVVMLAEEGVLDLDDDVRHHIPELPDFGETITLRHLIHHTSGLRDWPQTLILAGWSFEDRISLDQILRMVGAQEDLNFPPGDQYAYSNTGYNLLAEVVARTSGQSFRDFSEARIFTPLGMTRTRVQDDLGEVVPSRADSYEPGADGGFRRIPSSLTAPGSSSLLTTVEDLALWIQNFQAPVIGGAEVMETIHGQGILNSRDTIDYAFGQEARQHRGLRMFSHGGAWAGYRSTLKRLPDQDFAVVILANSSTMIPPHLAYSIIDLYLADELAPLTVGSGNSSSQGGSTAEGQAPWAPAPEELGEYTGTYESPELRTRWRLELSGNQLVARHLRADEQLLHPLAPDRFLGYAFGEIRFLRDNEGRIDRFTANSQRVQGLRFHRVP